MQVDRISKCARIVRNPRIQNQELQVDRISKCARIVNVAVILIVPLQVDRISKCARIKPRQQLMLLVLQVDRISKCARIKGDLVRSGLLLQVDRISKCARIVMFYLPIWNRFGVEKSKKKSLIPSQYISRIAFFLRYQNCRYCWEVFFFLCNSLPVKDIIFSYCLSVIVMISTLPSLGSCFFMRAIMLSAASFPERSL